MRRIWGSLRCPRLHLAVRERPDIPCRDPTAVLPSPQKGISSICSASLLLPRSLSHCLIITTHRMRFLEIQVSILHGAWQEFCFSKMVFLYHKDLCFVALSTPQVASFSCSIFGVLWFKFFHCWTRAKIKTKVCDVSPCIYCRGRLHMKGFKILGNMRHPFQISTSMSFLALL